MKKLSPIIALAFVVAVGANALALDAGKIEVRDEKRTEDLSHGKTELRTKTQGKASDNVIYRTFGKKTNNLLPKAIVDHPLFKGENEDLVSKELAKLNSEDPKVIKFVERVVTGLKADKTSTEDKRVVRQLVKFLASLNESNAISVSTAANADNITGLINEYGERAEHNLSGAYAFAKQIEDAHQGQVIPLKALVDGMAKFLEDVDGYPHDEAQEQSKEIMDKDGCGGMKQAA